ncbi:MAG TPA: VOC family protein [Thermoanaerobaculia bacterium]|jgi:predicted enzyme related to lactoylglutathione lyase|nr:VOC family protein [Thermoanaerobaculia bacterium]
MPDRPANHVAHFAINADDLNRARHFYEKVFGWRFEAWGPPGFFQITTGAGREPGPLGALQKRRELVPGQPTVGYECTVSVADVDAAAAAVVANGGTILIPRTLIPTVGHLIFFRDSEGNVVGAMQYDSQAVDEI